MYREGGDPFPRMAFESLEDATWVADAYVGRSNETSQTCLLHSESQMGVDSGRAWVIQ
jgi:hypothetical protein